LEGAPNNPADDADAHGAVERRENDLDQGTEPVDPQAGLEISSEAEFVAAAFEAHSGPMPSQRWLEAAEKLHPGATKIILEDFQAERDHQRDIQVKSLQLDQENLKEFSGYQRLRLLIVGGLAGFLAVAGVALIFSGKPVSGFVLLASEIAAIVAAFFGSRRLDSTSIDEG
jgi:hypothetical protein